MVQRAAVLNLRNAALRATSMRAIDEVDAACEDRESHALPTFVESAAAYAQTGGPERATLTDEVDPTDSGAPAPSAE